MRSHSPDKPYTQKQIQTLSLYPFLILAAVLPFSLYMHRSKIPARGIELHTFTDYLSYYHADILPLVLLCLVFAGFRTIRKHALIALTPFYYLAVFDWTSWHTQGNTFFFSDIYRAIQLIIYYPEFLEQISTLFKAKAIVLLLLPIIIGTLLLIKPIQQLGVFLLGSARPIIIGLILLCLLVTPFVFTRQHLNYNAITFLALEHIRSSRLEKLNVKSQEMATRFGHHSAAHHSANPRPQATHSGFNIILFVMETIPYSLYPSLDTLMADTNNAWLQENSIIFENHHTTHPESDRSNYSIVSGKYPPMWKTRKWKSDMRYGDSLPQILKANNYDTYLLVTAPLSFNNDYDMYKNLGFEHMEDIPSVKDLVIDTGNGQTMDRTGLYPADQALIVRAKEVITQHAKEKTSPFLMKIAPQSSHAPFHCPPEEDRQNIACTNDREKIVANATWQFRLIASIIDSLTENNLIDTTIVVVTGDHGIRSKQETPLFESANILQESTFRVPLLIAGKDLVNTSKELNHPTSHTDIAPTVLRLLGIKSNYDSFHGVDLFNPTERNIYLLGEGYLPANGFMKLGHYYMENRSSGARYASEILDFTAEKRLPIDLQEQQQIADELLKIEAFLNEIYLTERKSEFQ